MDSSSSPRRPTGVIPAVAKGLEPPNVPEVPAGRVRRSSRRVTAVAAGLTLSWVALALWVRAHVPGVPALDGSLHSWALGHRTTTTIQFARDLSWFGQTDITLPIILLSGFVAAESTRRFGRARAAALLVGLGGLGVVVGLALNGVVAVAAAASTAGLGRSSRWVFLPVRAHDGGHVGCGPGRMVGQQADT